ncbi:MAG: glycosyltransferase [Pseudomonadota bacterium]
MLTFSIGIMAYNEEKNIGQLLDALLKQNLSTCDLKQICVVSSGCTDRTEDIVREYMKKDKRIRLMVQENREGKSSAINLFLPTVKTDAVVLESGDTIPLSDTMEKLVAPLQDPLVGMTGARPVPVNKPDHFIGFCVNLLWNLHHKIACQTPKLGELVAFKNIVKEISVESAVDESSIEAVIIQAGLRLEYVGDAIVYNQGPENISDFLKQRRRISAGHRYLVKTQGYKVATTSGLYILKHLLKSMKWNPMALLWTAGAVMLEIIGRALGYYDFNIRKKNPFVWDIALSTKKVNETVK